MIQHQQLDAGGPSRWCAECRCGWRSTPVWQRHQADTRWHVHAGERRAAGSIADAVQQRAATALRTVELSEARASTRSRRFAVREERWRLRSSRAEGDRRADKMQSVDAAPWQVLNRVRSFIGCSVFALWMEYFTSGGDATYDEFGMMLTGVMPMLTHDHDLTATALNTCFVAAGLGAPVATSDDVLQRPLAGLQQ